MAAPSIDFETVDEDGYPTEDLLDFISSWDYQHGWLELMDVVLTYWSYEYPYKNFFTEGDYLVYELSTGGWSGNEDIVGALRDNRLFWCCNWYSSRKGGHHVFKVRN